MRPLEHRFIPPVDNAARLDPDPRSSLTSLRDSFRVATSADVFVSPLGEMGLNNGGSAFRDYNPAATSLVFAILSIRDSGDSLLLARLCGEERIGPTSLYRTSIN